MTIYVIAIILIYLYLQIKYVLKSSCVRKKVYICILKI